VNSFLDGDKSEGTLTSPEFEITHNHLSFLIGGGNHAGKTCLNLLVDGRVARTATGDAAERLAWKSWDVRDLRGKKATLEIVDKHTGGWGPATQPALWADFAPDFYAAVSWSDVPKRDGRRLWLGWMSNWQYANDVPTSPWRSAMSIPRALALRQVDGQWLLIQSPVKEMETLRGQRERLRLRDVTGHAELSKLRDAATGLYELQVGFRPSNDAIFDLRVNQSASEQTILRIDVPGRQLTLDRTRSGKTDFHGQFPGAYTAPIRLIDGRLKLRLFVDTSSMELFVNDGESVLSSLIFPSPELTGINLAVQQGVLKRADLYVWKLKSAWGTEFATP
jgi:sucrose-6-phosphate hydrolase SacC (GH32 family)